MSNSPPKMNPFPGLRPFIQEEDYLFFGREEQTLELLARLGAHRFVAVVGTSGSGKSSLVRCGLLSELQGGKMLGAGAAWEIAVTHPGGNPLALLTEALLDADLYDRSAENARENLLATLSRSHFGLVEAVKQAGLAVGTNFLLVVDQFEEIFRFHEAGQTQQEAANEFVSVLLEAAAQKEVPIYVVLTMRSDFIGECGQFEGLAEMVNRGEFLIPRLTREQYKRVIEGPIKVAGGEIAPRLLQRLLNDLGQQADQLPCLQHALMRTWNVWAERGDADALDLDDYQRVGRMSEALSLHADEIFDSLASDRQRVLCAGMFKALTVQETESRGIRRPQRLGKLCQILDVSAEELAPVIDAYRQPGVTFLMPAQNVALTDQTIIDISHESLMRVWTRLRRWVEEEAQAAGIYLRLSESAALYGQKKAGLYRDPELGIALAWRESQRPNVAWAERYRLGFDTAMSFLATSKQASDAEEHAREAARQRELEQARQLAEAQQQRLVQQQRAAGKLRKLIGGLAVVAIIAGLACVAALIANQRANKLAGDAQQNEAMATENAIRAKKSQKETADALAKVESQKAAVDESLAKAEAAEEAGRKLLYTTDMRLAPFVWRDDRTTAEQLRVLLANHVPKKKAAAQKPDLRGFEWHYYRHLLENSAAVFSGHNVPVADGAFAANGQLVTLDQNGQLRHWDLSSQSEAAASRRDLPGGPKAQVRVLSPDGRLAALAQGNKVHVFDTATGNEVFAINSADNKYRRLIFSRDEDRFVIVDDKIRWLNARNGAVIATANQKSDRGSSLGLSADGTTLAIVGHGFLGKQFSTYRLDAAAKKATPLEKNGEGAGTFAAAALSPDGQHLAISAKLSGTLSIFDATTGRSMGKHGSAHASPISALAFSGDSGKLATGDVEGTIKIWADAVNLTPKSVAMLTLKGHRGAIHSIAFSVDGKRLVTTSADGSARVWDLANAGASITPLERGGASVVARFSPDGQLIAAADGSRLRLWDAATGRLVRELAAGAKGRIHSVAFSPTDYRLLAVGYGGEADVSHVSLWDIDAMTELAQLPGATDVPDFKVDENTGAVSCLAFSPDGKLLVAGFGTKNLFSPAVTPTPLKVWDVATRRLIRRLDWHTGYCVSLDFSKDGALLASGSRDGRAILWSTQSWKAIHIIMNKDKDSSFGQVGRGMVDDVAFAPDSKTLALASREGTVQLWDVAAGKLTKSLKGHSSAVSAVAFSPDGRTLASGSTDQTVRLWNVETRRELMQMDPGNVDLGAIVTLAFSPDGKQLLAGGRNGTAFWSAAPMVWNDPDRAAEKLGLLLKSSADFQSRIRLLSENLRLDEALTRLDVKDARVQGALAAIQANGHASRQHWLEAVRAYDRIHSDGPDGWLRMPGLLRLATALLHRNRPEDAATLLQGGAERRARDGLPVFVDDATGELIVSLQAALAKRLADAPKDAGLLELRAELNRQDNNYAMQVADYSAVIKILAEKPSEAGSPRLRRLYHRRGDAYLALQKWAEALDDYAKAITPKTTDALLLSNRARAYEGLKNWDAAAADWSRAAAESPVAAKLLADFARRLDAAGQAQLAKAQFEKSQALYERLLEADPESETIARTLAQLLLDKQEQGQWMVLKPTDLKSAGGATLTLQGDGSILASGKNPDKDVYTLVARPGLERITAIRLEALPDPKLPKNGPGRYGNGNFHLSKMSVYSAGNPCTLTSILVTGAENQEYRKLIDGRMERTQGWGTWNSEGKTHSAVIATDVQRAAEDDLKMEMYFSRAYSLQHNLGRFRLSVRSDAGAFEREEARLTMAIDPWLRLAAAYAANGRTDKALPYFQAAMKRAEISGAWQTIFELAARYDDLRPILIERQPDAWPMQLDFARKLVERGNLQLAAKQPLWARAEFEKAHTLYTQLVAKYPNPKLTVLTPTEMKAESGAKMELLKDGSIFVHETKNAKSDAYSLAFTTDLKGIKGLRLEVLTDPRLPQQGPGWSREGYFVLNELTLHAAPAASPDNMKAIALGNAAADYFAGGADVKYAIDGKSDTGWGIHHEAGKDHAAVFDLAEDLGDGQKTRLTVRLYHEPAAPRLGRFRVAFTNDAATLQAARVWLHLKDSEIAELDSALKKTSAQ